MENKIILTTNPITPFYILNADPKGSPVPVVITSQSFFMATRIA